MTSATSPTADAPAAVPPDPLAFLEHTGLVWTVVNRFKRAGRAVGLDEETLFSEGLLITWKSLPQFDPQRGATLGGYLGKRIGWALLKLVNSARPWAQLPSGPDGDIDIAAPDAAEPDLEARETIERLLVRLPDRERDLIRRHYGLASEPSVTMVELGRQQGLSNERVRQIIERGLRRLRDEAERLGLHCAADVCGFTTG